MIQGVETRVSEEGEGGEIARIANCRSVDCHTLK